jgi:hypothetical protein
MPRANAVKDQMNEKFNEISASKKLFNHVGPIYPKLWFKKRLVTHHKNAQVKPLVSVKTKTMTKET